MQISQRAREPSSLRDLRHPGALAPMSERDNGSRVQGAVDEQRGPAGREPPVGQGPRRLRHGRGRRRPHDGVPAARAGAPPLVLWRWWTFPLRL